MPRTVNLGSDVNRLVDRRVPGADDWIYLEGCEPWEAQDHVDARVVKGPGAEAAHLSPAPLKVAVCPVCGNGRLKPSRYCLACDSTGLDGRVTYPGLPVGSACDPDWKGGGTRCAPNKRLKGGVG